MVLSGWNGSESEKKKTCGNIITEGHAVMQPIAHGIHCTISFGFIRPLGVCYVIKINQYMKL